MARSSWVKAGGAAVVALLLAGCMTQAAYAPRRPGETTGYTDRELAPGRWRVTFTGNSVTPRDTVENYLLLRAAEVTLAAGGSYFIFDTRDTRARTSGPIGPYGGGFGGFNGPGIRGRGFYGGWGFRPRWGYSAFGPPALIMQTTRYDAYAEIVVLKPGQESNEARAVDAHQIIAHLSLGANPPPPAGSPA